MRHLRLFVLALLAACLYARAQGDVLDPADARSVRGVVEAQLRALADGRPAEAFSYAAPAIQRQFQDAAGFIDMVQRSYPMLIKPVSVGFFQPSAHAGLVFQAVHFRDHDGHLWRAVYELQRQADRSWRISGCAVAPDDDASTT